MKRISVTFDSAENRIVVTYMPVVVDEDVYNDDTEQITSIEVYGDPVQKEYFDRETYVADWPDRDADCDAMGW